MAAKPFVIFVTVRAFCNPMDTYSTKSSFLAVCPLFWMVHLSLQALKAVLNGLNIVTSKGCSLWLVWLGKVMMSRPSDFAF